MSEVKSVCIYPFGEDEDIAGAACLTCISSFHEEDVVIVVIDVAG